MVKISDMKKFDFGRSKRSPLPSKRTSDIPKPHIEIDDAASDLTDSEHGGSTEVDATDGVRSSTPDPTRTREALETLRHKVDKIKMEIQREQTIKEEHVTEYLDLSGKAGNDEAKARNVKLVFEKNNSMSAQKIAILQKKLERYNTDLKRIEQHGASSHRAPKELLKDVGQGIKDFGGSVVGALVSKPKDHMSGGISVKSKSGSIDNLAQFNSVTLTSNESNSLPARAKTDSPESPTGSTTLPANFKMTVPTTATTESDFDALQPGEIAASISEASYHIARDSPHALSSSPQGVHTFNQQALEPLLQKLNTNADSLEHASREIDMLRSQMDDFTDEMSMLRTAVEEERMADRYDRLEEHLNDFVELTQNELSNLKQEISNMEEKMDYQLEERTRDLHDALENANTRITKLELQNQHQQLIGMEGVDNANAKVLLTKFINVLLAFLAVVLVFMSTISNIVGPILNARWKFVAVIVLVFAMYLISSRWDTVLGETPGQPPPHAQHTTT